MKNELNMITILLIIAILLSLFSIGIGKAEAKVPVIVGFVDKPTPDLIVSYGGRIKHTYRLIPAIAANVSENAINSIVNARGVAYVELDSEVCVVGQTVPWGVDRIDADLVWKSVKGTGVKIAVIDSGIDYNHPDLSANYKGGYDYVNDDSDPLDDHGHGTHVAGIIAAVNNEEGVVGVAPEASLYGVKVLDESGRGWVSDLIAGIQWSIENGMDVVSMSLGTTSDCTSLRNICDKAYEAGMVLVAATGNNGDSDPDDDVLYPARYDSVVAVAASDKNDERASWSSDGPEVELAAPGVGIYSTYKGDYAYMSGTSMACPHVSGTVALILKTSPSAYDANGNGVWDPCEVRNKLRDAAYDLGEAGKDNYYGYGLVNAEKATNSSKDDTPPSKVANVTVTTISCSQLNISWNANTEADLSHYNVYRGTISGFTPDPSNLVASITANSYMDTELKALIIYYYRVTAVDMSGNEGAPSDEVSGKTSEDMEGPAALDVAVNPNPTNGETAVVLKASIDDSGAGGSTIVAAEYFIDEVGVCGSGTSMDASDSCFDEVMEEVTASLDVSGLAAGSHTLFVHGEDAAGNWGAFESVVLEVTEAKTCLVKSITTGRYDGHGRNKVLSESDTFNRGDFVVIQVKVVDSAGMPLSNATVQIMVISPYGTVKSITASTDADGIAEFRYRIAKRATSGTYNIHIDDVMLSGYSYNSDASVTDKTFTVQ